MIISGHQPVYLPWLGLWHKLYLCDTFVYMDTVQYLENDWNNRNLIRTPQGLLWLTAPLDRKNTKGKALDQIRLLTPKAGKQGKWQEKHWQSIRRNYRRAPYFDWYAKDLEKMYLAGTWESLVDLCFAQFQLFSSWLGIKRKIVRMSQFRFQGVKDRLVLDHALKLGAKGVVFGAQGPNYVRPEIFSKKGIKIYFQNYRHPSYRQAFPGFKKGCSVLDLLFNHGPKSPEILLEKNVSRTQLRQGGLWHLETERKK